MERFMSVFRRFAPALSLASLTLVLLLAFSNLALWRQMQALDNRPLPKTFHLVNLAGTDVSPGASGVLVITGDGEYGTLVVDNLQHLSLEQQYQLWLIRDGKRTSGGVFSVSGEGYAALEISAPMPLATYQSFGITVEPYGGSPGPTGERVLGGSLSY
jgi:anti-sigma-K factor RskA